jgi:hypothetical protein
VKKAHKREKHPLANQAAQPDIQPAKKLAPITAISPPVSSNTATSATTTLMTGTAKMVAELDTNSSVWSRDGHKLIPAPCQKVYEMPLWTYKLPW